MIGYDISNEYVQISYFHPEKMEPESISSTIGTDKFQIPFILCKETNSNVWYYGDEAVKMSVRGKGILLDNLFRNSINEKSIQLEEKEYRYLDLLILFFRKTINLITSITHNETGDTIVFAVDNLDTRKRYILDKVIRELELTFTRVSIITYEECFYYFMIHQRKELWNHEVTLFHWNKTELGVFHLQTNHKITPKTVSIIKNRYDTKELLEDISDNLSVQEKSCRYDVIFSEIIKKEVQKRNISSIYLIGDFYNGNWMKDSLKLLCQGRRVFQGNNLFTKGACYCAFEMEKVRGEDNQEETILLTADDKKIIDSSCMFNHNDENLKTKSVGDYYLSKNLYHKAMIEYKKIVKYEDKESSTDNLSIVWNNLGVCYGNLFLFSNALKAFLHSYKLEENEETGYNLVCMMKFLEKEEMDFDFLENVDKELLLDLGNKFGESVSELFEKEREETKKVMIHMAESDRKDGKIGKSYEMLEALLSEWKDEYRSFVSEKNHGIN